MNDTYSGAELVAASDLGEEICDYLERGRTGLRIDGALRGGVAHIIRTKALPWFGQRAKDAGER
jgi:hypothetical protein